MNGIIIPGRVRERKPRYLVYDNLGDRRDVWHLLDRLHPRTRVAWLGWCCQRSHLSNTEDVRPLVGQKTWKLLQTVLRDRSEYRLTNDIFQSFWHLCADYNLDTDLALCRLVELNRKQRNR